MMQPINKNSEFSFFMQSQLFYFLYVDMNWWLLCIFHPAAAFIRRIFNRKWKHQQV